MSDNPDLPTIPDEIGTFMDKMTFDAPYWRSKPRRNRRPQ